MGSSANRYIWGPAWEGYYFQFWDKTQIVNRLRSLAGRGKAINWSSMCAAGEWQLLRAASFYFGSWRAAVEAAGFKYDEVRNDIKWTRNKVGREIRQLRRKKEDLSSRSMQLKHPALFAAAVRKRLFGSWERALAAGGVQYTRVAKYERWDEAKLRRRIADLKGSGVPLNAKNVLTHDSPLYYAALRYHGSWGRAMRALGYDYDEIALRHSWTHTQLLARLRELERRGVHMSDNNVREVDVALYTAACRAFGGWRSARRRAGVRRFVPKSSHRTALLPGFEPWVAARSEKAVARALSAKTL